MKFANAIAVSRYGEVVKVFRQVSENFIRANVGKNEYVIQKENPDVPSYWDFDIADFVPIPKAPTSWHVFDYTTKQWIDSRTLNEIKAQKWTEIKTERDQLEFGGFEFEGNIYDSDQVSQGRIMGAALAGVDQVWTTADNSTVNLTGAELLDMYQALQAHVASVHERGRTARLAIERAITKEEVDNISL